MKLENIISDYISRLKLLSKDGIYIVALSGGPDSVAMLCVLHSLGFNVHAAHCNFHLRGEESDRDENFCKSLCSKLDIPLHIVHFDTFSYASLHKVSIEMAARELRYHWFAQLSHDIGAKGICIAHHQDDQVETVLLNIIRGTGLRGLLGMKSLSRCPYTSEEDDIKLVRPMLCVSEEEIMSFLKAIGQDYVIDSTNLQDDAQRNKLRLDVIPLLEKINPGVKRNIIRMTENLSDIETIADDSINKALAESTVVDSISLKHSAYDLNKLLSHPAPLTILWALLSPIGFNRSQAEEIKDCKADNKEWVSNRYVAIVSHYTLFIIKREDWERELPTLRIPEPGLYRYGDSHISISEETFSAGFTIPKEKNSVAIDREKVVFPLILRPICNGDRFTPFGMKGSKLVNDYLKDRHRNIISRHNQLVLTDKDGNIIWLVGETIDNNYRIVPHSTNKIIEISYSD